MSTGQRSAPEQLNVVWGRWWRRLHHPGLALAEINSALRAGELIATRHQEGMAPGELPASYWRAAQVAFDKDDPLAVVVMEGNTMVPGIFDVCELAGIEELTLRRPDGAVNGALADGRTLPR